MENENRVAIISMIIDNENIVPEVNRLLHEYSGYILSRMGLPCRGRGLNIISVVADAPADKISALSESWADFGALHQKRSTPLSGKRQAKKRKKDKLK